SYPKLFYTPQVRNPRLLWSADILNHQINDNLKSFILYASYQSFGTRFLSMGHQFSQINFLNDSSFKSAWSTIITCNFPLSSLVRSMINWYILLTSFQSICFSSNSDGK